MSLNSILSRDTMFKLALAITHPSSPEIGWSQILTGRAHIAPFSPLENDEQRSAAASLTVGDAHELSRICCQEADSLNDRYWKLDAALRDEADGNLSILFTQAQSAFEEISGNLDILAPAMTISEYLRRFRNMDWRLPSPESAASEEAQ